MSKIFEVFGFPLGSKHPMRVLIIVSVLAFNFGSKVSAQSYIEQQSIASLISRSPLIIRAKVLKEEEPFGQENQNIRFVLCDILDVNKSYYTSQAPAKKTKEGEYYIVTLLKDKKQCPVEVGHEYVFFCQGGVLTPAVVGPKRIFQIEKGMVSVYAFDFPETDADKTDPLRKIKVPIEKFMKRITEISIALSKKEDKKITKEMDPNSLEYLKKKITGKIRDAPKIIIK